MNAKPSFKLFLKTVSLLRINGANIKIYDRKKQTLTEYDESLYYHKKLFVLLNIMFLLPIWTLELQIRHILRPLSILPNWIFEIFLLELAGFIALYITLVYFLVYRTLNMKVLEVKTGVMKNTAQPLWSKILGVFNIIIAAAIIIFCVSNSYSVNFLRSVANKDLNNPGNVLLLANYYQKEFFVEGEDDLMIGRVCSTEYVENEYMRIEIEVNITPLQVKGYVNDEEVALKLRTFDERPRKYSSRYMNFFWEENLFRRNMTIEIPIEMVEDENTLRIVCGEIDKSWTVFKP